MKTIKTNKRGQRIISLYGLDHKNMRSIILPLWFYYGNFHYYTDGKDVYYFSFESARCDSGYFSDLNYFIRSITGDFYKYANKKGFFKNPSIVQIFGIEKYITKLIKNQIK